jgi:putative flavoprotein involved in K+ transport
VPSLHNNSIDTIVIGAGHAGLAASHYLTGHSIDHLLIERGEVANSWRHERWDSLTLLTPNWQTRLPGYSYQGSEPDGFMPIAELIAFLDEYADRSNAPVREGTAVKSVELNGNGYRVQTDQGEWQCRTLVIASGACNTPAIPKVSANLPREIEQVSALEYRNPEQLPKGGVLVVGASATGLQLAEEIHRSGRPVTISTGEHVRIPRTYRGRDIQYWMDASGLLDEGLDEIDDVTRARHLPSPQLVGNSGHQIHDLNRMTGLGMKLAGRLMGVQDSSVQFSGSLKNVCALADLKMNRLLKTIDEWIDTQTDLGPVEPPERFEATHVDNDPMLTLDLDRANVRTVLWATGYRPDYSWLNLDILDRKGLIRHEGGVAASPGMYVLGMPFLRKRKSSFIHGIEDDARYVVSHLASYLAKD